MIAATATLLERYFGLGHDSAIKYLNRLVITLAALGFVLLATGIIAFESLFPGQSRVESLEVGSIAPQNIYAPETVTYVSEVLTQQRREASRDQVTPIYDAPDPSVARQQTDLARQILTFIDNVRQDPYASREQKIQDMEQITALDLSESSIVQMLDVSNETWSDMKTEIIAILERVMRGEIKPDDMDRIREQLPTQVSVRFEDQREINAIVSIVSDLLRPNTRQNVEATQAAREEAAQNVEPATRSFEAGQLVIPGGTRIDQADYEALQQLGLLQQPERRFQEVVRALLASVVTMVAIGLYVARFRPSLMHREPRLLTLLAAVFLLILLGAQLVNSEQLYIYPAAALGLLYVAIVGPEVAVAGMVGVAFLIGLMSNSSLEMTAFFGLSGLIGSLTLRHSERLNSFFMAGLIVTVSNVAVIMLFNLNAPQDINANEVVRLTLFGLLNGVLTAAAATAGMYLVTTLFNLPTALKLIELGQPNQPLLQRLLREAPGTYQHSLQVANLSEQAANAINANAELTRVAALYHDIGKMQNPIFFTENQGDMGNPHDALNDPYRSADIIIGHVTVGDAMARQYRLPNRIRDFIREHHGTSLVYVFYKHALAMAGDDASQVELEEFTYPGPRPQTPETAIMMLADSCEAAVRSRQPKNRDEIGETVRSVFDGKRTAGQLDDSNLTLNQLKTIQDIFIDILKAMYHPRINYSEAVSRVATPAPALEASATSSSTQPVAEQEAAEPDPQPLNGEVLRTTETPTPATRPQEEPESSPATPSAPLAPVNDDDDVDEETPFAEVPRLRRTETAQKESNTNGYGEGKPDTHEEEDTSTEDKGQ